jgi:hypothetical protein
VLATGVAGHNMEIETKYLMFYLVMLVRVKP